MNERHETDDPRKAGGGLFDAGGPHERDKVMIDSRRAVLVEQYEVAVAHGTRRGEPLPDKVAMVCHGRINRPPDDASSAQAPAEPIHHLHMLSWELAADLVAELFALATRDGTGKDFNAAVEAAWEKLRAEGLA